MLPLGTTAPDFNLPDSSGKFVSLAGFKDKAALVVIFMCNHCPYVIHIRAGLAQLARDCAPKNVGLVGINANDVKNYPEDSPAKMKAEVRSRRLYFPLSLRRNAGRRQKLSRRLHAGHFSFRPRPPAGLSRPVRRQPSRQRPSRDRKRFTRRSRRRACRKTDIRISGRQHGLQHQMESRQRAGLFLKPEAGLRIYFPARSSRRSSAL